MSRRARHQAADVGNRQAAFPPFVHGFGQQRDFRIDQRDERHLPIVAHRLDRLTLGRFAETGDEKPEAFVHLWRGQSDSCVLAHRFEHVVDEALHGSGTNLAWRHRQGFCTKDRVAHAGYFQNRHGPIIIGASLPRRSGGARAAETGRRRERNMKKQLAVIVLTIVAAGASGACFDFKSTSSPTSPTNTTSQALGGNWATVQSLPGPSGSLQDACVNFKWSVNQFNGTSGSGTFSATCVGNVQVSGSASATLTSSTAATWSANATGTTSRRARLHDRALGHGDPSGEQPDQDRLLGHDVPRARQRDGDYSEIRRVKLHDGAT